MDIQQFQIHLNKAIQHRRDIKLGKADIRGVQYDVVENGIANVRDLLVHASSFDEIECIVFDETRLTFKQFFEYSQAFAHILQHKYSIKPRQKIAIAMQNRPEWLICFAAIVSIGAVAVPLNSWWQKNDLAFAVEDANVVLLIGDKKRISKASDFPIKINTIDVDDKNFFVWINQTQVPRELSSSNRVSLHTDDDVCILYTSGSTGRPKGVILTHRGILTSIYSWSILADTMRSRFDGLEIYGKDPAIIMSVPLFHVAGLHSCFLNSLFLGRKIVMTAKWEVAKAAELINREKVTTLVVVPTMTQDLVAYLEDNAVTCPTVVDVNSGGSKLQSSAIKRIQKVFPNASPSSGYAMTETNAIGAVNFGPDYIEKPESTGKPIEPLTKVEIRDNAENVLPNNNEGEIWIKSAAAFKTYHNLPEVYAETFKNGWIRTGDLGLLDNDGFLYITGRLKNLIIRGGENISSLEVEAALTNLPHVSEAFVFGVPDERFGEVVAAIVSIEDNKTVAAIDIIASTKEHVAHFKVPGKLWVYKDKFPRTATQKIDMQTLKHHASQHLPDYSEN